MLGDIFFLYPSINSMIQYKQKQQIIKENVVNARKRLLLK